MTSTLLREAGEALCGPQWQEPLARAVSDRGHSLTGRTMRRYAAGQHDVPGWLWGVLADMLAERSRDAAALAPKARQAAQQAAA